MSDKHIISINKDFKPLMIRQRKEFMDLLLRAVSNDEESVKKLNEKFGTKVITKLDPGNSMTILVDGEVAYKI